VNGWRTMESAPLDGTRVLGASRLDGRPFFVEIVKWSRDEDAWTSWYGTRAVQPSLWMPLPDAPLPSTEVEP
jgi:hypothetical protein